jgi:DnaJ-class molecular chaperone
MQAKPDYYGVLGVSRDAAAPEIKAAFQKLALAFHAAGKPKNIADVEKLRSMARACQELSGAKKRKEYDCLGFVPPAAEDIQFAGKAPANPSEFWPEFRRSICRFAGNALISGIGRHR